MDDNYHYHFCYLSMILDAYSEEIVGWSVGPTLDTDYPPATHEHRYDDSYGSIRVNR